LAPESGALASPRKSWLLLPRKRGFLPPDDEHVEATVLGFADELTQEGCVLCYQVEGTGKDLPFCR